MKRNVSDPKILLNELVPLSDQLASWLPGRMYHGFCKLSRILFASCNSSSEPKSVISPERITKLKELSLLIFCTVLLRSSSAFALPIWVSDICANRNSFWPKEGPMMPKNRKRNDVFNFIVFEKY